MARTQTPAVETQQPATGPEQPAAAEQPATETAAATPLVKVKLAHFKDHEGKSYRPGDELEVPAALADSWEWGGYAKRVTDAEQAGESTP